MIHNGEFREDLYCRLAVLTVETSPLRDRREDIPAMIALFLREAADALDKSTKDRAVYSIQAEALKVLCECDYPGNIRSLRNLIYELTSYTDHDDAISIELVNSALSKLRSREVDRYLSVDDDLSVSSPDLFNDSLSLRNVRDITSTQQQLCLSSILEEGDILLPLELCVLRRGETFKQWTARAKRCSIEATRRATGGTMHTVAERLGLTHWSLKGHLRRAKRTQSEALFDWQRESD